MRLIRTAYFGSGEPGKQVFDLLSKCKRFVFPLVFNSKVENILSVCKEIIDKKIDVGIVCNLGQLLPETLLSCPKHGFWNIHYSLLPKYRGATPVQSAILAGDRATGATVLRMTKQLDAGDILGQQKMVIESAYTTVDVTRKLSGLATEIVTTLLPKYIEGSLTLSPQKGRPTYCFKSLTNIDNARINWHETSEDILRSVRAYYPDPCAWTQFVKNDKPAIVKILSAKPAENIEPGKDIPKGTKNAGKCRRYCNKTIVSTLDGQLEITQLLVAGGKRVSGSEFTNGYLRESIQFI